MHTYTCRFKVLLNDFFSLVALHDVATQMARKSPVDSEASTAARIANRGRMSGYCVAISYYIMIVYTHIE